MAQGQGYKAVRYYGQKDLRLEQMQLEVVGDRQVLMRPEWCGLCGTDLHEWQDGHNLTPPPGKPHRLTKQSCPVTMGHEYAGTVLQIGKLVTRIKVGDRCVACKEGARNACENLGFYGLSGLTGGLAELSIVDEQKAHVLPDNVPNDIGALIEPLSCAWHAVQLSGFRKGQTALVIGAGPIGAGIILCLEAFGAKTILVSEPADTRRHQAKELGAHFTLDPRNENVTERAKTITNGGCDLVFDASGKPITIETALACVRPRGTVYSIAIWNSPITLDMSKIMSPEIRLLGGMCFSEGDFPAVIDAVSTGRIRSPGRMITSKIPMEETEKGFQELIENTAAHIKIIVSPIHSGTSNQLRL